MSGGHIKLVEGDSVPQGCRYATLSHCWGDVKSTQLSRSNYEAFKQKIHPSQLTKTFNEAIEVCIELHLEYLWIDSLCITQDKNDLSDWLKEATQMEQIYANGYINIAATASSNGNQGLFRERDLRSIRNMQWTRYQTMTKSFLPPGRYVILDCEYWRNSFREAPLLTRGWVYQELMLARRVLHFTNTEIMWECNGFRASESFDFIERQARDGGNIKDDLLRSRNEDDIYLAWNRVRHDYCRLQLTYNDDKSIAIMGVAHKFQKLLPNDEYLNGMWKKRLSSHILWRVAEITESTSRRRHRLPSVSWLSVDGHIPYQKNLEGLMLSIVDITYGSESSIADDCAQLTIVGRLPKVSWERAGPERLNLVVLLDSDAAESFRMDGTYSSVQRASPYFFFDSAEARNLVLEDGASTYCVPCHMHTYDRFTTMILLCQDPHRASFRRAGILLTNIKTQTDALKASQPDEAFFPCAAYDPETGNHTFFLR